ncbi:hypothetical protein EON83_26560 [bacterium]|nr:MAG: hypothetical protein EON83_26560 [bacterium]
MCAVAGFAFLFIVFAIWNLFHGKTDDAVVGFIAGSILAVFAYAFAREQNEAGRFLSFLEENETTLKNGATVDYHGAPVSLTTEATQFMVCISFIILTTQTPSRFYIRGSHKTAGIGIIYSVVTLFCGWWGIPHGPIYSIAALYRNVRGGHKRTVAVLLEEIAAANAEEQKNKPETQPTSPPPQPIQPMENQTAPVKLSKEKGKDPNSPWS